MVSIMLEIKNILSKGEEALKFQGFDDCFIKKVSDKVSNRHLLQQAGNAMTANVVQSIGEAILDRLEEVVR